MTRLIIASAISLAFVVAGAGCGGSRTATPDSTMHTTTQQDVSQTTSAAALIASARKTLQENYRVSVYALWHNAIPGWAANSTRGPALASLRTAVANRRSQGVRIKTLSTRRTIRSLRLNPSYTTATAVVVARQRVQPSDRNGKALGRTITVRERGRFTLHRLGRQQRFVVWKVVQLS